jgi:hypothetical protein
VTAVALTASASRVRTAGWLCTAGALIGLAGGLVLIMVSPAVASDRYSYPLTPDGHRLIQVAFALNHVLLLVGVLGLARAGATGSRRLGRTGVAVAVAGWAMLALCEVGALLLAGSAYPSAATDRLDIGYGVSTIAIGLGMILAGAAVLRERLWTGWARYIVLASGVAVFVIVIPGIAASFVAGRLVLVTWMLIWVGVGLALVRAGSGVTRP